MAIRTHLQDVRNLDDPLLQWNWDLFIPRTPAIGGDVRELTVKFQTSEIPGIDLVFATTELKGVKVHHKSRREFAGEQEGSIIETRLMKTRSLLADWARLMHDPVSNTGAYKSEYAVDGVEMLLYDDKALVIRRFVYYGWAPQTLGRVQVGSDPQGVVYPFTFRYDYYDEFAA